MVLFYGIGSLTDFALFPSFYKKVDIMQLSQLLWAAGLTALCVSVSINFSQAPRSSIC